MQNVDLKKCLVSELIDKTIYLTKLVIGADAFRTYEDEHMIMQVKNIIPKTGSSDFVRCDNNSEYSLCAEFTENGQSYFVLF